MGPLIPFSLFWYSWRMLLLFPCKLLRNISYFPLVLEQQMEFRFAFQIKHNCKQNHVTFHYTRNVNTLPNIDTLTGINWLGYLLSASWGLIEGPPETSWTSRHYGSMGFKGSWNGPPLLREAWAFRTAGVSFAVWLTARVMYAQLLLL